MSNRNYTQYSKFSGDDPTLISQEESQTESTSNCYCTGDCDASENECACNEKPIEGQIVIPEVEPTIEPEIRKFGRVRGCKKLNVRRLPNRDAAVLIEVVDGAKLLVDEKHSTATFYKVCTECGIEGYCMKQFIKVLP